MRHRTEISEAEMVAVFLRAEIASERFGARLLELLRRDGRDRRIAELPDTNRAAENAFVSSFRATFAGTSRIVIN